MTHALVVTLGILCGLLALCAWYLARFVVMADQEFLALIGRVTVFRVDRYDSEIFGGVRERNEGVFGGGGVKFIWARYGLARSG